MTVSDGDFRRPPQLWEQKLAALVSTQNVGAMAGGATADVPQEDAPGTGAPGVDPGPSTPAPGRFDTPSTPTLTGGVQSIMVTWDGLNSSGAAYPYESAIVEIHMSTTTGFTVSDSTLKGTLRYPGNVTITGLDATVTYYFKLRGKDSAGNYSGVSAQASSKPGLTTSNDYGTATINSGAVSFNARAIGGITTTVGTSAPSSPVAGDVWLDTSSGAVVYKRYSGSTWATQAWGSDSLSANCITATQIATAAVTAGAIAADAVTAAKIKADAIDGKTITGATIRTSATVGVSTPKAGVILDTSGLRGYDASGNQTININASTGAVTIGGYQPAGSYITTGGAAADVNSGSTTISGGKITTGSISADRIDANGITGKIFSTTSNGSGRVTLADASQTYGADAINFFNSGSRKGSIYYDPTYGVSVDGKFNAWSTSSFQGNVACNSNLNVSVNADVGGTTTCNGALFAKDGATNTSTTIYNTRINTTTGEIKATTYVASAQRFKHDIIPLTTDDMGPLVDPTLLGEPADQVMDPADVLLIIPVQYRRNSEPNRVTAGFIAEQAEQVFPTAAVYDEEGQLETIDERAILAGLLAVVKDQQATIADLTARVEALEAK